MDTHLQTNKLAPQKKINSKLIIDLNEKILNIRLLEEKSVFLGSANYFQILYQKNDPLRKKNSKMDFIKMKNYTKDTNEKTSHRLGGKRI